MHVYYNMYMQPGAELENEAVEVRNKATHGHRGWGREEKLLAFFGLQLSLYVLNITSYIMNWISLSLGI